ncbi:GH92 family glycosyl hydrolase [Psychromonas aquimarina]|uniref:GH92 family glycosyl hydrolase n=1 Tax=Psychromonas aquimarina TaxID=444919 RepID=UPI000429FAD4|nr:GH92 family glycosyl hydrolase [Psychromonas aquimarina]
MFKKRFVPLAIAMALGISGCNSDSSSEEGGGGDGGVVDTNVLDYVDPFIGTAASGHTFPGAVVPQGMVQLSPDTTLEGWDSASGYHDASDYKKGIIIDKDIPVYGFSHTHLSGTGVTDLGDILVLPYTSEENAEQNTFDKDSEQASAGYYKVVLNDSQIEAQLTTSTRVGYHKYSFPEGSDRKVKLDIGHTLKANGGESIVNEIEVVDAYTVRGYRKSGSWVKNHKIYFYAKFSAPIAEAFTRNQDDEQRPLVYGEVQSDIDIAAYLDFGSESSEAVEIRVGLSPVDWQGAEANLAAEVPDFGFDKVKTDAEAAWSKELSVIEVKGGTDVEKTNFYSGFYHSQIAPIVFEDVDGRYRDLLGNIREGSGLTNYSIYSMWDTFRAVHPLQTIIYPQRAQDFANDLIRKQQEAGILPKWEAHSSYTGTMIGYPSVAIIADAIVKGMDVDPNTALLGAVESSTYHPEDFPQIPDETLASLMPGQYSYYEAYKYIQVPNWNSVSYALEMSYYDWTIAQIALAAGNTAAYDKYMDRSTWSQNHWDPEEKYFVPVDENGDKIAEFDPYKVDHYWFTEGNAWQWQWTLMQDLDRLTELMGGTNGLNQKLDELFTAESNEGDLQDMTGYIGQYVHGNEPSHHVIYLYNRTNETWKTQEYLDQVYKDFYHNGPDGLIGNEDVGQMSAWYIMSAMGFYQITPGDPTYTIGRPIFDEVIINLPDGEFKVTAENNGPNNLYVKEVTINGKPLDQFNTFKHSEIYAGGELHFVMTAEKPAI